jgi:protein phosphatase
MGATIVTVWLDEKELSLAHVGDSRAYRLRSNVFERLTRDHSLVAEQVRLGMLTEEQAETSPMQTVLIRALGAGDNVEVDVAEHALLDGDFVMLCSDGLSRMVADSVIAHTLSNSISSQNAADQLVQLAKDEGGTDNITVVVLHVDMRPRGLLNRLRLSFKR